MQHTPVRGKILCIGPSYSGKTYLTSYARRHGIAAYDSDAVRGLNYWYALNGIRVLPSRLTIGWLSKHRYYWRKNYLQEFLRKNPNVILFGQAGNVFNFLKHFDKVYFLHAADDELRRRFHHNQRESSTGHSKSPKQYEQRAVLSHGHRLFRDANARNISIIDSSLPPEVIFNKILTEG